MYFTILFTLAQLGSVVPDWIHITENQTAPAAVVRLEDIQALRRERCSEADFNSTGMDFISESSFIVIVSAVVNRAGEIERFRMVRRPFETVDFAAPIQKALTSWRFAAASAARTGEAFEITIVLPKAMGAVRTSACSSVRPQKSADQLDHS